MTIDLSTSLEEELTRLARLRGRDVPTLVEEAIRQYLDAEAITDVSEDAVSATQESLAGELDDIPTRPEGKVGVGDESGRGLVRARQAD